MPRGSESRPQYPLPVRPRSATGLSRRKKACCRPPIRHQNQAEAIESEIGWRIVRELNLEAAGLLEPAFEEHKGRNGRLSMQTDPRLARSAKALADQAKEFSNLAEKSCLLLT